jgi:Domain of unknown function (DUF4382)/Carboxypeptidase regulatory-like domain
MKKLAVLFILSTYLIACSNEDQNARIEVRLTDAPGDYEAVNIDIQGLEVHTEGGGSESGWKSLEIEKGVYNMLEFTNGIDTLLGSALLPAGKISQIRLVLGDHNSIQVDGSESSLSTPSAQQSGLKLNLHAELKEGVTYKILLDFDVARSIVKKGNGGYSLKPVIRTISEATSGAIKGTVTPVASLPAVFAIMEDDTVATTYTDETGKFLLRGLPAGTYTVSFNPKEGYEGVEKENVSVTLGSVTDLGIVAFQ